ncbi:hypothetical protein DUZ99_17265 [Xylanibacillus composti]|uniref:Uncharacterized protein n=1 Tax=Xylanibacillus composti TaxID=1572762 RepID=A0A8J4H5Q1_9BACL|nr:hypothetical protein [Xylanibacillus composti]MDT9726729.1 hypothetical protein [Xylanibacillus composti]GIQ69339.1 hypothetical protein XYCOK13_21630 [Xylanibacillus composti]
MKARQLPIHPNPGLETECYHNFRLSIIMADPMRTPWCYGHFVNLQIKSKENMMFPFVRFEEHLDVYAGMLREEPLDYGGKGVLAAIRGALDQGHYVMMYFNWSRLPCSNFYRGPDLVHDAIIYGYDDERQQLDLLAFEINGKSYGRTRIAYAVCEKEFAHVAEEHLHANRWFAYYGFPLSRICLEPAAMFTHNWRSLYFSLERGNIQPRGEKDDVFSNGFPVNVYMADYFARTAKSRDIDPREYGIWNIVVTKMLQHKKWMLRRLAYMQDREAGPDRRLLQKSMDLYEQAKQLLMRVRMDSLLFQKTTNSRHLAEISENFHAIYEKEKRAVPLLMEYLVEARLDLRYREGR